jgi:hypothetical protein
LTSLFTPRGLWNEMTGSDRIASAAVLVAAGALTLGLRAPDAPARAVVRVGGEIVATLSLDRPGTFPVDGRNGRVVLTVEDGAVRVTESSCTERLCIAMGAKHRPGELIACVPNALAVRLEGRPRSGDGETPDSVAR